ncbi:uncharacterized protein [Narcine bancroftii]|uniref:uncharacterized protein n=1 Tax=Narcine bancroftii TaxID=1343680 RepID=UPI0038314BD6
MKTPEPVLLQKHCRPHKVDLLVDQVELRHTNPQYAFVTFPDGRGDSVATRDLTPATRDLAPATRDLAPAGCVNNAAETQMSTDQQGAQQQPLEQSSIESPQRTIPPTPEIRTLGTPASQNITTLDLMAGPNPIQEDPQPTWPSSTSHSHTFTKKGQKADRTPHLYTTTKEVQKATEATKNFGLMNLQTRKGGRDGRGQIFEASREGRVLRVRSNREWEGFGDREWKEIDCFAHRYCPKIIEPFMYNKFYPFFTFHAPVSQVFKEVSTGARRAKIQVSVTVTTSHSHLLEHCRNVEMVKSLGMSGGSEGFGESME